MSDENEFFPFSDDSSSDGEARSRSSDSDTGDEESVDPNLNMSVTEDGTVVRTRGYYGKDYTDWRSTTMAGDTQTTRANGATLPRNCTPKLLRGTFRSLFLKTWSRSWGIYK